MHHLQEHFVNFIKNDNLGQISTWLLAHADRDGADCDACERLAELHSTAVDFPKTGRPATLSWEEGRRLVSNPLFTQQCLARTLLPLLEV